MTVPSSSDRRWFRRLILLIVGLILLAAIPLAIRSQGISRYQQAVAQWRAAGEPDDEAGILARQPVNDLARLDAWIDWERRATNDPLLERLDDLPDFPDLTAPMATADDRLPAAVETILDHTAPALADGLALLDETGLRLDTVAYRQHYLHEGGTQPLPLSFESINLLTTRNLARWLQWQSLRDTAGQSLVRLDHLRLALGEPSSFIDCMIAIAVDAICEETFLLHARLGSDEGAVFNHWLDQPPDHLVRLAEIYRTEAICFALPIHDRMLAGEDILGTMVFGSGGSLPGPVRTGLIYLFAGHDSAKDFAHLLQLETTLRSPQPDLNRIAQPVDHWIPRDNFIDPDHLQLISTVRQNEAASRHARLTARLIRRHRHGQPLPATAADLPPACQDLLRGGHPLAAELVYEALSPTSFRCRLAPGLQHAGSFDRQVDLALFSPRSP